MQPCDFAILDAPRAFPNASPWVSLRCTGGSFTVRAFHHGNGFLYFVICDVERWGAFRIVNHDRVRNLFGPSHVMRMAVPGSGEHLTTISEAGLVFILARHKGAEEAAIEVLEWLVSSAIPAVKQASAKAQQARAEQAARQALWGESK